MQPFSTRARLVVGLPWAAFGCALGWAAWLLWPSGALEAPLAALTLGMLLRMLGAAILGFAGLLNAYAGIALAADWNLPDV